MSGPTNPSMSRKIQTNVATLMTSGTVTKNPAMKLRRIHWSMTGGESRRSRVGSQSSAVNRSRIRQPPGHRHTRRPPSRATCRATPPSAPRVRDDSKRTLEAMAGEEAQEILDRHVADDGSDQRAGHETGSAGRARPGVTQLERLLGGRRQDGRDRQQEGEPRRRLAPDAEQHPDRDGRSGPRHAGHQRACLRQADQQRIENRQRALVTLAVAPPAPPSASARRRRPGRRRRPPGAQARPR